VSVSAVIVGAGFGGIAAAIALRREGVREITVLERGAGVGGVWEHNTYPGAACDVPSHLYSYSFAPNPHWGRRFAGQPEIRAYLEDTARRCGVLDAVRCGVEVGRARWDREGCAWEVETSEGSVRAELLIAACGQLTRPSIPAVEGIGDFDGPVFHSSSWRHDLELRGKRVGVIGTGASAIQFVPAIQPQAASLAVFQRTAPWILPKPDGAYGKLAQSAFERLPALQRAGRLAWWTLMESAIAGFVGHPQLLAPLEAASRAHLRRQVSDPVLRERLSPHYRIGCKRILLSSDWYPALSQPNVEVLGEPIARVTPQGVQMANGSTRALDVLIFGTGFDAHDFVAPMEILGREERSLRDVWGGLPQAWHGLSVPGFPNMFLMYGPNTFGGSGSAVYMLESQARHVAAAARALRESGATSIEVKADAFASFIAELRERQPRTVWATGGCSSWYLDESGRDPTNWPGYTIEYRMRTRAIDAAVYELERPVARVQMTSAGRPSAPGR
jgi:cation diffusion facilitator CzcD-associated flavoprotein CzcO